MPKTIQQVADEIRAALPPLPVGFYVKPAEGDNIIVGNDELAFTVTRRQVRRQYASYGGNGDFPEIAGGSCFAGTW